MANPNLSSEEQTCIAEVQKVPEAQRQSTFERACSMIKDKTKIALLATTLSLATPTFAEKSPETNPNYQSFYTQIVERYPKLSPEQHQFFAVLYTKWLGVIDPKNEKMFNAGIRRIIWAAERQWLAIHIVNDMVEKQILPPNHPYTKTLISTTQEIDKMWQEKIAQLDQKIQQADQKIQQADQKIQQEKEYQERRKKRSELFKNL